MFIKLIVSLVLVTNTGIAHAQARDPQALTRDLSASRPVDAAPAVSSTIEATSNVEGGQDAAFTIGAVGITGNSALPNSAFAPVIEPFLGRAATTSELRALAQAVANVARERGFVFATASVPAQAVATGSIRVALDEGRIDEVRITGSDSKRLRQTLSHIVGPAVERVVLEKQLLLAGDIPGIEVTSTRYAREGERGILYVNVREHRGNGYASIDNFGNREVGAVRARLRYDFFGVANADDALSVQAITTPLNPHRLVYATLRYNLPVTDSGAMLFFTGSAGRVRADNGAAGLTKSTSVYASAGGAYPLLRRNRASIWGNAEIGFQQIEGRGNFPTRDRIVTLSSWLYGTTRLGDGRLSGAAGIVQGLGFDGTTVAGDPRSSRLDGNGRFTKVYYWADWFVPIGGGVSVRVASNGQIADRALLAPQEMGLGGAGAGRAFSFYEHFGDSGVAASGELRWRKDRPFGPVNWLELYAFVDGGRVWNLAQGFGGGDLASAGGGLRFAISSTEVGLEAAVPISISGDPGPRGVRANLSLGQRF